MVEFYLGKRTRFSYAHEDIYGTVTTSGAGWGYIPVESVTPSSKSEIVQINTLDSSDAGDSRNVDDYFESLRRYGLSVEGLIQHFRFCAMAWGENNDVYAADTHTISESNDVQPFSTNFGYQHSVNPGIMEYLGCKINKLDFACTKGEFLKFTAEIVAQKATSGPLWKSPTSYTDGRKQYSMDDLLPYHYSHIDIELNNVGYCETDAIKMSINNNLLSEPVLCSANEKRIAEPVPQLREYDASATIRIDNIALYDLWETGTKFTNDPVITFTRDRGAGDVDVLTFTLVNTTLESAISPLKISDGIVLVELPMKVEQINVTEETNLIVGEY